MVSSYGAAHAANDWLYRGRQLLAGETAHRGPECWMQWSNEEYVAHAADLCDWALAAHLRYAQAAARNGNLAGYLAREVTRRNFPWEGKKWAHGVRAMGEAIIAARGKERPRLREMKVIFL